ncbi:MAG: hypothetical protein R3F46_01935 [bacterium]
MGQQAEGRFLTEVAEGFAAVHGMEPERKDAPDSGGSEGTFTGAPGTEIGDELNNNDYGKWKIKRRDPSVRSIGGSSAAPERPSDHFLYRKDVHRSRTENRIVIPLVIPGTEKELEIHLLEAYWAPQVNGAIGVWSVLSWLGNRSIQARANLFSSLADLLFGAKQQLGRILLAVLTLLWLANFLEGNISVPGYNLLSLAGILLLVFLSCNFWQPEHNTLPPANRALAVISPLANYMATSLVSCLLLAVFFGIPTSWLLWFWSGCSLDICYLQDQVSRLATFIPLYWITVLWLIALSMQVMSVMAMGAFSLPQYRLGFNPAEPMRDPHRLLIRSLNQPGFSGVSIIIMIYLLGILAASCFHDLYPAIMESINDPGLSSHPSVKSIVTGIPMALTWATLILSACSMIGTLLPGRLGTDTSKVEWCQALDCFYVFFALLLTFGTFYPALRHQYDISLISLDTATSLYAALGSGIPGTYLNFLDQLTVPGLALLSLIVFIRLRYFLTCWLGDVAVLTASAEATQNYPFRRRIIDYAVDRLEELFNMDSRNGNAISGNNAFDRCVIISHSLGTAVAYEALAEYAHKLAAVQAPPSFPDSSHRTRARKQLFAPGAPLADEQYSHRKAVGHTRHLDRLELLLARFITFGCPLNKIHYFFSPQKVDNDVYRNLDEHANFKHRQSRWGPLMDMPERWLNVWINTDPVSGPLDMTGPGRRFDYSRKTFGAARDFVIRSMMHQFGLNHSLYFSNALVRNLISMEILEANEEDLSTNISSFLKRSEEIPEAPSP